MSFVSLERKAYWLQVVGMTVHHKMSERGQGGDETELLILLHVAILKEWNIYAREDIAYFFH